MTYFPHNPVKRPATPPAAAFFPVRPAIIRDILWGQPLFKAPVLPSPRVALDPFAPAQPDWGQTPGSALRSNGAAIKSALVTQRSPSV